MLCHFLGSDQMRGILVSPTVRQTNVVSSTCFQVKGYINHLFPGQAALYVFLRADANAYDCTRAGEADLLHDLGDETFPVVPFAAVHICSPVGKGREALVFKITVGPVDLNGVEAR